MKVDEAVKRFAQLRKMIERELPVFIHQRIAHNAVSMIQNRVVQTQRDYMNRSFSRYSERPMWTTGTTEKSDRVRRAVAGSKAKRRQLQWITVQHKGQNIRLFKLEGGYAEMRRIEGFSNTNKSFEFTGQMWRGFGVKRVQKTKGSVTVTIGGRDKRSQELIDENSKREGVNIVNISDEELEKLAKQIDKELQRYVDRVGLS